MTGTFTLTGRILDKNKQPVKRARLVLKSNTLTLGDPAVDEIYAPTPYVTTDDSGYLCVAVDNVQTPADTPGVGLVVGVQYTLRGVNHRLIGEYVFTAPSAGSTLDLTDLVPEPPAADPTWADVLAALSARLDAIEAAGFGFTETAPDSGLFLLTTGIGGGTMTETAPGSLLWTFSSGIADSTDEFVTLDSITGHLPTAVEARITALAGSGGGGGGSGGTLTPDTANPGFYLLAGSGLTADPSHPGFYLIGG